MISIEALVVSTTFESVVHRRMIIQLVQDNRLPAIYPLTDYSRDGGLRRDLSAISTISYSHLSVSAGR